MNTSRLFKLSLLTSCFLVLAFCGSESSKESFQPKSGQKGKDVIWVPTTEMLVDKILDMAKVTPQDYVIDLGSGDGRTVIAAAKRGARAVGIEYNPDMVELSQRKAVEAGVSDRAQFVKADLFETDLSEATVITMFLLPQLNIKLRPKILELKSGTRIVSNSFHMGEWEADEMGKVSNGCVSYCTAYLWIVPAKAAGTWRFPEGHLRLEQKFQKLFGTLNTGETTVSIEDGRLYGDQINFRAGGVRYTGRVNGNVIEGVIMAQRMPHRHWRANRVRYP